MKKIYSCDMNIVKKHMDETGVLKAEPVRNFYAVLIDHFKRIFGVHGCVTGETNENGKVVGYKVLGFAYVDDLDVPIELAYTKKSTVVFVRALDIQSEKYPELAQYLLWTITESYQDMGVEITIEESWLELRFFHILGDEDGFEYNGLHFKPTNRKLTGSFQEITRHLRSTSDMRLRKYEGGYWNYDNFYDKARKEGCGYADTFICLELNQEFCPGENEMFMYVENL